MNSSFIDSFPKSRYFSEETSTETRLHIQWNIQKSGVLGNPFSFPDSNYTLGDFSNSLLRKDILDHKSVALPGSVILLPKGVKLVERVNHIYKTTYDRYGFSEYSYPQLVPLPSFEQQSKVFPLDNKLLLVGNHSSFAQNEPRAALTPSGEAQIYSHWRKKLRSKSDLPIEMFQKTTYFRPVATGKHSGNSIFKAMEASDIFEFHTCHASEGKAAEKIEHYYNMLKSLTHTFCLPMLWSTRPSWTNNGEMYEWAIGGDCALPIGETIQLATLYMQGQKLSEAYHISFKEKGSIQYPWIVTGAITRRALFAHLFLSLRGDDHLLLHPNIAPYQLSIVYKSDYEEDCTELKTLEAKLIELGIRLHIKQVKSHSDFKRYQAENDTLGTPLQLLILGKRHQRDNLKLVLRRSDTYEEATFLENSLPLIPIYVKQSLENISLIYQRRMNHFFSERHIFTTKFSEVKDIIDNGCSAICPMLATKENVLAVAAQHKGEVLGFTSSTESLPCVMTNKASHSLAIVSRRI